MACFVELSQPGHRSLHAAAVAAHCCSTTWQAGEIRGALFMYADIIIIGWMKCGGSYLVVELACAAVA
jgi:hypothetical protein